MEETVQKLLIAEKGILAADESTGNITKKFANLGLISTPELNKKYREMLFTTPDIEKYISGVILFDETIKQGLGDILRERGIIIGIKVDEGLEKFKDTEQKVTKGLQGLSERLDVYKQMGAKFTKWRGVISISDLYPTDEFLLENLSRMADFAKVSQEKDFVPIVEPEILFDGNHTNARCEEISTKTLKKLFEILNTKNINLKTLILKTSMVLPGKDSGVTIMPLEVSNSTLRTVQNCVPNDVPGILFLSGGQTSEQAIFNLNEIVKLNNQKKFGNWDLSFSFGRALQKGAMTTWSGKDENKVKAQVVFQDVIKKASQARMGEL